MPKISHIASAALLSAVLSAGPVALSADIKNIADKKGANDTIITADEISGTEKEQTLRGNVEISVGDLNVSAQEMTYNPKEQTAVSPKPITVNMRAIRMIMNSAAFDGEKRELTADDVRGGVSPAFISGSHIVGSEDRMKISDASIYFCEPHWSSIAFNADLLGYDAETDRFELNGAAVYVAGVPVLPLPSFKVIRIQRPPVRIWANTGRNSTDGIFLRTTTHITAWDYFEPGLVFDAYQHAGVLVGPALAYDTEGRAGTLNAIGDLKTGYINDGADRIDDIYGNKIGGERGFIEWTHKQELNGLEISASIHKWSDSKVMRNFRPDTYDKNQNPDNYVEFVVPDSRFYISAITRMHLNDFQNTQQRLPEVRFDMQPSEIKDWGVFQHFNASFAMLREETSDQYTLKQINDKDRLESSRADAYYGLTAPIKFGNIATLTPVGGIRTTYYGETVPAGNDSYWRTLGQVGFDFQLNATGASDYRNETWGINGIRHVLRPVVQYRYIPGINSQSSRIPQIDRETYYSTPNIIDLAENRAVDELYDEHVFRVGVENLLQTRDSEYGSRDLLEFNIYQDLRKTYRPGDTATLSDNFAELQIHPAGWLDFYALTRTDVENFNVKSFSTGIRLRDADIFSAYFAFNYIDNPLLAEYECEPNVRQFSFGCDYRINSYLSIFGDWRYDARSDIFTDQKYGIVQRLGNSWEIKYTMRYRKNARDDNKFSFGVSLNLVTF